MGVGARPRLTADELAGLIDAVLADHSIAPEAVLALATLDRRADHPALRTVAAAHGWPVLGYPADELAAVPAAAGSARVRAATGTPSVAEAAALRAAGANGGTPSLVAAKRTVPTASVAVATRAPGPGEEREQ
ncbi:cobalamin biosynthesis protein [Catenuloplanes indicus]|uniref:Cobalamin biosynthesis protein CbiG n=1 Tax=Catenuloplanes indicus TaxID=137267 RepID=A0AAE4B2L3_9ACTN|nr:cobalamin biosynthesis protein [Catenuloplanes indicus]MDQ0370801.1 cobalamin biosynthesis protein CbiG [Catenuloplanes indicus]